MQKAIGGMHFVLFAFLVLFILGTGCGSGSGGKIESTSSTSAAAIQNGFQNTQDPNVNSNATGTNTAINSGTTTSSASNATYPVLSWTAPIKYTDNTDIVQGNLKEYRIYYGLSSRSSPTFTSYTGYYPLSFSEPGTNPGTVVSLYDIITAKSLTTGAYYFSITAVDSAGSESDFSNEVSKFLQ